MEVRGDFGGIVKSVRLSTEIAKSLWKKQNFNYLLGGDENKKLVGRQMGVSSCSDIILMLQTFWHKTKITIEKGI